MAGKEAAHQACFEVFRPRATNGVLPSGCSAAANTIFLQQKQVIMGNNSRTSCTRIFKDLNTFTRLSCYILLCLVYIHNCNDFLTYSDVHHYNTRNQDLGQQSNDQYQLHNSKAVQPSFFSFCLPFPSRTCRDFM